MSYLNHTDYDTAKAPGAAKHGEPAITYDVETGQQKVVVVPAEGYANFANKLVRQGFIRKVFGTGVCSCYSSVSWQFGTVVCV